MITASQFRGTADEFELALIEEVQANRMTANEASRELIKFRKTGGDISVPLEDMPPMFNPENHQQRFIRSATNAELEDYRRELSSFQIDTSDVDAEIADRKRLSEQGLSSITDPKFFERLPGTITNATIGLLNTPLTLLELASGGIEAATTDTPIGETEGIQNSGKLLGDIQSSSGVSSALTPAESAVEALPSLLTPGGIGIKGATVGGDFLIDQSVRELTDAAGETYETVFDKLGVTNNDADPVLTPIVGAAAAILGGTLTVGALNQLSTTHLQVPTQMRQIRDLEPDGPENLATVESTGDLLQAQIVDEQAALVNILRKNGIPNLDEMAARIEFDTHAAQNTRVQEALNTGKFNFRGRKFEPSISPVNLYKAYNELAPAIKTNVRNYINLRDIRDDLMIGLEAGTVDQTAINAVNQQIRQIELAQPEVKEFSQRYNEITRSLRDFAEGSLFTSTYRTQLDATRSNYVPLEISDVDPSAPFMQRLIQAQTNNGTVNDEWFLQNRSIGQYDLNRRQDPFEMLLQGSEATLSATMRNDTKVAIIDDLLNSETGSQTMRLASAEDVSKFPQRIVSVWRDGEQVNYITSELTASLLQLDPYVAKYPWAFIPKRVFEQAAVGPLSITFAPVTALRDALGGRVTRPDGLQAPSLFQTTAAIPAQVRDRATGAIAQYFRRSLMNGDSPIPESIMDRASQEKLAQNVGDAYTRSIYHLANESGGFDASLMKSRIELARNALGEVRRTISESDVANNAIVGYSGRRIRNMINGFTAVFNAIQDAPRFAAIQHNVAQGMPVDEATRLARQLTGDVTKSGRTSRPDGSRIGADTVDQGAARFLARGIGDTTGFLREATPFFNPMVQGNRRLLQSIAEDPIAFNMRAWTNIGLPAMVLFGWNETLGPEYNDYAMNQRSSRDVSMSMYMGIPGKPPEEGIEIPIMHELLLYNAPFTRSLYGLARGENSQRTRAALSQVAEQILSNSVEVGYPVVGAAAANIAGISAPDGIIGTDAYKIREDEVGILSANMEKLSRTLFASIGATAVNVADAMSEDPSFGTFQEELFNNTIARAPIANTTTGSKSASTGFTIPDAIAFDKFSKINRFRKYYDAFLNPKRVAEDPSIQKPGSRSDFINIKDRESHTPITAEDLPFREIGPEQMGELVNPLYAEYGELIINKLQRGSRDATALYERDRVYKSIARKLRKFNAGDKEALTEWQAVLNGLEDATDETQDLIELLDTMNVDLTNYQDRVRMINEIERRRGEIVSAQLDLFDEVEADINADLRTKGIDVKFDIDKHLDPHDPNPLGDN